MNACIDLDEETLEKLIRKIELNFNPNIDYDSPHQLRWRKDPADDDDNTPDQHYWKNFSGYIISVGLKGKPQKYEYRLRILKNDHERVIAQKPWGKNQQVKRIYHLAVKQHDIQERVKIKRMEEENKCMLFELMEGR